MDRVPVADLEADKELDEVNVVETPNETVSEALNDDVCFVLELRPFCVSVATLSVIDVEGEAVTVSESVREVE